MQKYVNKLSYTLEKLFYDYFMMATRHHFLQANDFVDNIPDM